MAKAVLPNAFIIGVQKAGTTTLDDWMSQHPQVYCYDSLKDVHLFGVTSDEVMNSKFLQEPQPYTQQPVVLQSAVNYIFYPALLKAIHEKCPNAKLVAIIRNPVDRAISAYSYFKKMLREKREPQQALQYEPQEIYAFSKDTSDFTYIEHGLYYRQLQQCFAYFKKEQVLVIDYDDLVKNPTELTKRIYDFLGVDSSFTPDLTPKNVTGEIKNKWLQENLIKQNKLKKWIVKYIVNPFMPRAKRKLLKKKMFEMNTAKNAAPQSVQENAEEIAAIKQSLIKYFEEDTRQLDRLLGTDYYKKWFATKKQPVAE